MQFQQYKRSFEAHKSNDGAQEAEIFSGSLIEYEMPPAALAIDKTRSYLNSQGIGDYLAWLGQKHPEICAMIDFERSARAERDLPILNVASWEFEANTEGGRGQAYNKAQRQPGNRATGMKSLLGWFGTDGAVPGPEFKLLDVLGGDGTLARFCASLPEPGPAIITADISRLMIEACLAQGLGALRQSATRSMIANDMLDGVLIAYGSHHLLGMERSLAATEAWRTLRPGGRFVLHDFETGGATARWFEEVVDRYSRTGHAYPHFSRSEMRDLMCEAGFELIDVVELADPFTILGNTADQARTNAIIHMFEMYDLVRLAGDPLHVLGPMIEDIFGPISVDPAGQQFVARIDRKALVAIGEKPVHT